MTVDKEGKLWLTLDAAIKRDVRDGKQLARQDEAREGDLEVKELGCCTSSWFGLRS